MVRAIALGSRGAGYTLAVTYGCEEYVTTFGYAVAEKAHREKALKYIAAFAGSIARGYCQAEQKAGWLPSLDLIIAGDWAKANPRANPLNVTETDLRAAMTAETAQAIMLPTAQEILAALGTYFSRNCSFEGMLAHTYNQRGKPPPPPLDTTWMPSKGACGFSRLGLVNFTLSPIAMHRQSCERGAEKDSYVCKIDFRWRCEGDGMGHDLACKIVEAYPNPSQINLVDDPNKQGRGWIASKLVYDGEYKEAPPSAVKDYSPCDAYRGIPLTSRMRTALALGGCG